MRDEPLYQSIMTVTSSSRSGARRFFFFFFFVSSSSSESSSSSSCRWSAALPNVPMMLQEEIPEQLKRLILLSRSPGNAARCDVSCEIGLRLIRTAESARASVRFARWQRGSLQTLLSWQRPSPARDVLHAAVLTLVQWSRDALVVTHSNRTGVSLCWNGYLAWISISCV